MLRFEAVIVNTGEEGASIEGKVTVGDRELGPIDLFFAYLPERIDNRETFSPDDYLAMLRQLRFFEVGRRSAGPPRWKPQPACWPTSRPCSRPGPPKISPARANLAFPASH